VRWAAGRGESKWETLPLRASVGTVSVGFVEHGRVGRLPIEAERCIADLIEKVQVLDRGVVNAVGNPNAALAMAAKHLAQYSLVKARRISDSHARSKVIVASRRQGAGNARISRNHPAWRSSRELG